MKKFVKYPLNISKKMGSQESGALVDEQGNDISGYLPSDKPM